MGECPGIPHQCQDALRKIQSALDGPFDGPQRRLARQQLAHCAPCIDAFDFEVQLRLTVSERCAEDVPISLRFRIEDALRHIDPLGPEGIGDL